jgi:hypothetical protein
MGFDDLPDRSYASACIANTGASGDTGRGGEGGRDQPAGRKEEGCKHRDANVSHVDRFVGAWFGEL